MFLPNTHELAWAAGFFDGEGSSISRSTTAGYWHTRLSIHQVNRKNLERFQSAVAGLGNINGPYDKGTKPIYQYQVSNWQDVQAIMAMLWKFLGDEKREQYKKAVTKMRTDLNWGRHKGRPRKAV